MSALCRVGYARDRDAVYWRASLLPARRLARVVAGTATTPVVADMPVRSHPVRAGTISHPGPARPSSHWPPHLPTRSGSEPSIGPAGSYSSVLVPWTGIFPQDLTGFEPIEAPEGRFYAVHPFVVQSVEGTTVYVEDCPDGTHVGSGPSIIGMAADGRWTLERVVLDDLEHRAYPHALSTGIGLVLTPDSGRSGGVDVFVDHGQGTDLELIGSCLEDVAASDPTLLWHDDRFWLFVTVTGQGMSPWDELHLYSAKTLSGPWDAHPRNPVVADVRRARPAGRIFRRGDVWIRPGQDCSVVYGRRIVLSAITSLTPDAYEEHEVGSIEPEGIPNVTRTHTYTFDGSIEALDGYRQVPRWRRRPLRP